MPVPDPGATFTYERTFTPEDVRRFADLTNDTQAIHTEPDEAGRRVVHGLLTGSLMTKIGGDLAYLAATMTYEFRRPVYTGETITCTWTVDTVEELEDRYSLENTVVYDADNGDRVIEATTTGVIWKD